MIEAVEHRCAAGSAKRPMARPSGGFTVDGAPAVRVGSEIGSDVAVAGVTGTGSLVNIIALQEPEGGVVQDRAARRRAQDLLSSLRRLQRQLLDGYPSAALLEELTALTDAIPGAVDGGLKGAVAAIALRARIEIARYHAHG